MESRNKILMNLSEWRGRHREQTGRHGEGGRRGWDKLSKRRTKAMSCSGPIIDDGGCISALE